MHHYMTSLSHVTQPVCFSMLAHCHQCCTACVLALTPGSQACLQFIRLQCVQLGQAQLRVVRKQNLQKVIHVTCAQQHSRWSCSGPCSCVERHAMAAVFNSTVQNTTQQLMALPLLQLQHIAAPKTFGMVQQKLTPQPLPSYRKGLVAKVTHPRC